MTHERLLDIAIREFGLKGIEGASTRGIAKAAGTAMSSITYHYGGKEGLYLAAADHIAAHMSDEMAPLLAACRDGTCDDPQAARANVHAILEHFVTKMAGDSTADWSLFIMREQMSPTEAFDRIYAGMMGEMLRCVALLIARATGRDEHSARITAATLFGQGVAMRASRASVVRLLDVAALEGQTMRDIQARVHSNIDAILDRMIAEGPQ